MSNIKKKIALYKNFFEEYRNRYNIMEIFYREIPRSMRLSDKEVIELYKSKKDVGLHRSVLYFLLPEEQKREFIDDILEFDELLVGFYAYSEVTSLSFENEFFNKIITSKLVTNSNLSHFSQRLSKMEENELYEFAKLFLKNNGFDDLDGDFLYGVMKNLNQEHREELILEIIQNSSSQKDSMARNQLLTMVRQIENEEIKLEIAKSLLTKEYFSKDEYVSKSNLEQLMSKLDMAHRRELVEYLIENKKVLNKSIKIEYVISYLPAQDILGFLESRKYDASEIVSNVKGAAWTELYYSFVSMGEEGKKYLTSAFLENARKSDMSLEKRQEMCLNYFDDKSADLMEKCTVLFQAFHRSERLPMINELLKREEINDEFLMALMEDFGEDDYKESVNYEEVAKSLMKKFNLTNYGNFRRFINRFGARGIEMLENDNIISLINFSSSDFDKVMSLFSEENMKFNLDDVNTIVNSFLQRKFRIEHKAVYNVFGKFEELALNPTPQNIESAKELLDRICEDIDVRSVIGDEKIDMEKVFKHDAHHLDLLHKVTDAFIAKHREIYVQQNMESAIESLGLRKYYAKAYIKKNFIDLNSEKYIFQTMDDSVTRAGYTEEELQLIRDKDVLSKIIHYKKKPNGMAPSSEIKKYMRTFDSILNKLYDIREMTLQNEPEDAVYEYDVQGVSEDEVVDILGNLVPGHLKRALLDDEKLFGSLCGFLKKYKFVGWGDTFTKFGESCGIGAEPSSVSTLINYFGKIYASLQRDGKITLPVLLDYVNAYSSSSKKYSLLIGEENYNLIVANPGPNSSCETKEVRLGFVSQYVRKMYERETITVPSGERVIETDKGKNIKFSIGDIYDPIALTYGERTGACMRIKGVYHDLYTHCLTNKNGFHVRFEDPETGEFISRVSGFRNGNTVFLNQLRNSVSDKYTDEELVEYLNKVARFLVESTKNDPHPIENVIVSDDYAMQNEETSDLGLNGENDELHAYNGIHNDVGIRGVILYTSNEENHKKLMPYKFGDEYSSEYKPYNRMVKFAEGEEAVEQIERINLLNGILNNEMLGDIELLEPQDVDRCIYGHGWVVYVDKNKVAHEFIIDKFKDDERLRKLIDESKEKYLGGVTYAKNNRKNN